MKSDYFISSRSHFDPEVSDFFQIFRGSIDWSFLASFQKKIWAFKNFDMSLNIVNIFLVFKNDPRLKKI